VVKKETAYPNIRRQLAIRIATRMEFEEFFISRSSWVSLNAQWTTLKID